MPADLGKFGIFVAAVLALGACSDEPRLLNLGAASGAPDEFGILPSKPLEVPSDYTSLPTPTLGGSNLTDPTPKTDAVAALGGNPAALTRSGVPASDAALLNYAQRNGLQPGVREELASADLALRKRKDTVFFLNWFGGNSYFKAYRSQSLDQIKESERLKALGVVTPSSTQ